MNERRTRLESQYEAAEAGVDASDAALRKASAERLEVLLQRPAKERLGALTDAALTPFDREQLERSLEAQLPKHRSGRDGASAPWSVSIKRFARHRRRGLIASLVAVAPIAFSGVSAVLVTPWKAVPVQFNKPLPIDWTLPDGSVLHEDVPKGPGIFVEKGREAWLRKWFPNAGYAVAGPLSDELLSQRVITRPSTDTW